MLVRVLLFACSLLLPLRGLVAADLALAEQLKTQGEAALVAANTEPAKCVDAALLLTKARGIYQEAEDWEQVQELNAYIYWAKKRMTNDHLDAYLAGLHAVKVTPAGGGGGGAVIAAKPVIERDEVADLMATAQDLVEAPIEQDQAVDYLTRAEAFAADNPDDPFKVHLRFLEVAERFESADTAVAVKAMRGASDALERYARTLKEAAGRKIPPTVFQAPAEQLKPGTLPLPQATDVSRAQRALEKQYAERFRVEEPDAERKLARWLFAKAKESTDDPVTAYALADLAAEAAVDKEARALMFCLEVADWIQASYQQVDPVALKTEWLRRSRGYPPALAIATLLEAPDDAEANGLAGKYLCFEVGDWKQGLPLIAEAADEELKRLGEMEHRGPEGPAQQRELAEAWYQMGKRDRTFRDGMWRRALTWFRAAESGLSGVSKDEVAERITEIVDDLPIDLESMDWRTLSEKQWDKLPGNVVICHAKYKNSDSGIAIGNGQKAYVVPHPTDEWAFETNGGTKKTTIPDAGTGTGSIRVSASRQGNGSHRDSITGPAHIVLQPVLPGGLRRGIGAVRVKLIVVSAE